MVCVSTPIVLFLIGIGIVNILQSKKPDILPEIMQSWDWAPLWVKSLEPYDRVFRKGKEILPSKAFSFKNDKKMASTDVSRLSQLNFSQDELTAKNEPRERNELRERYEPKRKDEQRATNNAASNKGFTEDDVRERNEPRKNNELRENYEPRRKNEQGAINNAASNEGFTKDDVTFSVLI